MWEDVKSMLKNITLFNLIILLTVVMIQGFVKMVYGLPMIIGLVVAIVNFNLRGLTTAYLVSNKPPLYVILSLVSYTLRIFAVAIIGLLFFTHNKYYVVAYMMGYILHFGGVLLYGMNADKIEGV